MFAALDCVYRPRVCLRAAYHAESTMRRQPLSIPALHMPNLWRTKTRQQAGPAWSCGAFQQTCCSSARGSQPACSTASFQQSAADRLRECGPAVLTAMLLASPSGARAEGEIVPQSADLVLSVAFGFAVAALTVLTLGVLYLSLTSWLDKRTETKDRERLKESEQAKKLNALGITPKPKKKMSDREVATRGGGKGFGG